MADASLSGGPRRQERAVLAAERAVVVQQRRVLGVHDEPRPEGRDLLHRGEQLRAVEVRELVDARRREEALEAEDAGVVQRRERAEVLGHRTAPEADVDVGRRRRRRALDLERVGRRGGRQRVQRHVDDRRHAARGGRERRRAEALPLGAARLVHVHVRVDESGQQHGVVGHQHRARAGDMRPHIDDVGDETLLDDDRGGPERPADPGAPGADDRPPARHRVSIPGRCEVAGEVMAISRGVDERMPRRGDAASRKAIA